MSHTESRFCLSRLAPVALAVTAFLPLLISSFVSVPALAQGTTPVQRSYINPFPGGDRYRIAVLGDSLAEGLWSGLYRAFEDDPTLEFLNRSKPSSGFTRSQSYNWDVELDKILNEGTYQIAIVMFGANDNQAIRKGGEWLKVGSDGWREIYGVRVEGFIKRLRAANIATYWVGLPVMRSPEQTAHAEMMNEIFREKAFINGAKFIETWSGFVDESGRYSAYGPDMQGQVKRLRSEDGVHFTMRGSLKLAHYVEKELRKDLNLAKQERNIPLAGDEGEQAKVTGHLAAAPAQEAPPAAADTPAPAEPAQPGAEPAAGTPSEASGGQAATIQQSKVGEVSLLTPTISDQSLQAAQSAGAQASNAPASDTEMITTDIPGGLTALATLSALTDPSLASSRPRLPLNQRPYYKVLIKGEQPKPKDGRADDFTWPPS
jgi:hypothetical protein